MERQFIIVNKNNEELSFNSTDIFGHTPEGLGVEFEATTYQAYNSFNDMLLTVKQNEISLKLTLGNDSHKPYAVYMKLLKFLNVGNLILRYIVPDVGTFERKIALRSLSKKDMDLYSVLQEDIKFSAMSPWYSWVTLSKDFDRVLNAGRIWDDSRTYQTKYAYSWSNTGLAGTIYSAYSWSSDGKDRFTTIFPNLSILSNTRDYENAPNINETYYKRNIISSGGVNNSKYIQQSNTNPSSSYKDTYWSLPLNTIKANTRYTLSFYARGTGKVATFIYPTFLDTTANSGLADNVQITPAADGKYEWALTDQWVKHTYTFNSLASVTAAQNFIFRLENGNSVDICLPKIEEGSVATEWMPRKDEVSDGDYPSYLGRARVDNTKTPPNFNLLTDSKDFINKDLLVNNQKTSIVAPNSTVLKDGNDTYLHFISTADNQYWLDAYLVPDWSTTPPPGFINANILPNSKYTFSFWAKGSGKHTASTYDKWTAPSNMVFTFALTNEWKFYSFTVTSSETIPAKNVEFFLRSLTTGSEINIKYPKVELGSTATPWMPAASETTVTDRMQPTAYNAYVWLPTNIQSGKDPVVYRGDFTREFPRLNLLDGTKDFSGDWQLLSGWVNDGTYKGLTVKKRTGKGSGFYKIYTVPTDGTYTFSSYLKSSGNGGTIRRWVNRNWSDAQTATIDMDSNFDWKVDAFSISLKAGDIAFVRYEITSDGTGLDIWSAGHKWEKASTATPWMPSASEVTINDYPLFLGKYEGLGSPDLDDPLMYSWKQYGYQATVDKNMVVEPDFSIDPPLLANTESKKLATNWQVFNTGTNVGSVVTKTTDGLKMVNTSNNSLYLRPNQAITLKGNNVYRLEYDITVDTVQQNNDLFVVFTNQYQLPNFTDTISADLPYIKIPLTGAVTTNKDVGFNPISVHNIIANTKTHRIIDITVPFGYNYAIVQAVNSSQSTSTYNNFKLSYPIDTINHPANGPYSIISPKTNVYQVDYSRASSYLEIENDSMYFGTQEDSSLRIVIKATATTGNIKNPSWYLTDKNGNKLQTEGFLTGIPVGYELVVSSDPFERLMVLRDSSGKLPDTEIDTFIDPMATGWIRVPLGDSRLILSDTLYSATGGFNAGSVSLEYKKEWVIV